MTQRAGTERLKGQQLALFDLDNTLLVGDSDHLWGEFLCQEQLVDVAFHRRENERFYRQYQQGQLDTEAFLAFSLRFLSGLSLEQAAGYHQRFMQRYATTLITGRAQRLLAPHREDVCVVITSTNRFITAPLVAELGLEHLIATEVEVMQGHYSGKAASKSCYQAEKITRLHAWLAERGQHLGQFERSYFYSDSINDLPLLEVVSHPVVVSPDAALRATAEQRAWPIDEGGVESTGRH